MNLGFLITRTLDDDERTLLTTIGEAIARTSHEVYISTRGDNAALAKGLIAGRKAPHTISKGLLTTCETVVMYVDEETIARIDRQDAWGTAHVIAVMNKGQLDTFAKACIENAERIPQTDPEPLVD